SGSTESVRRGSHGSAQAPFRSTAALETLLGLDELARVAPDAAEKVRDLDRLPARQLQPRPQRADRALHAQGRGGRARARRPLDRFVQVCRGTISDTRPISWARWADMRSALPSKAMRAISPNGILGSMCTVS